MNSSELIDCAEHIAATKKYIDLIYTLSQDVIYAIDDDKNCQESIAFIYYSLNNLYNRKYINARFIDGISFLISSMYLFYAEKRRIDKEYFTRFNKVFSSFKDDMSIYQNKHPHNILAIINEYGL